MALLRLVFGWQIVCYRKEIVMTVAEVEVYVKPESLTTAHSSKGYVTGIIYFSSGSFAFPEDVWDDFPVVIVGWWLNALTDYKYGAKEEVDLNFMDGSFLVRLSHRSDLSTETEMIQEKSGGDEVEFSAVANMLRLYKSIDEAADILIQFCERKPTEVPYYPELVEAKRRARDAFRNQLE